MIAPLLSDLGEPGGAESSHEYHHGGWGGLLLKEPGGHWQPETGQIGDDGFGDPGTPAKVSWGPHGTAADSSLVTGQPRDPHVSEGTQPSVNTQPCGQRVQGINVIRKDSSAQSICIFSRTIKELRQHPDNAFQTCILYTKISLRKLHFSSTLITIFLVHT